MQESQLLLGKYEAQLIGQAIYVRVWYNDWDVRFWEAL